MGLLAPNTSSAYDTPESAWRAADDFAFQQGYALSEPIPSLLGTRDSKRLYCHRGCDTIFPDGMDSDVPFLPEWYFEDPCPFSMSLVNYSFDSSKKPIWRLSTGRHPHTHGPRDLLHLCKIRHPNFEQKHIDLIREEFAQGSCDEYILELVREHFTQGMDPVLLRDIRSITNTFRFESGGLFTFIRELDDHLTEISTVHYTRHDERNRPDSKLFMLGSEDPSELAMGKGFFQLVLINVTQHASQSWKLVEINGYTARGTTFPVAVAVTTSEDASFYAWLIERFSEFRGPERQPTVVISNINPDVADSFKQRLPDSKIQLCMSHLSKDILRVVKQLWKGAKGKGALMKQADLAKEDKIVPRQENQERGRNDFLMAWKRTVFAPSVAEFKDAWEHLQTDFAAQTGLIEYLKETYLPFREQWARAYTKKYRNYGVDIPTPKGGFQSKARSYFQTPVPNLLTLAQEASEQREYMTHEYAARAAMEGDRHKTKIWAVEFLRDIQEFVSEKGIDMVYEQYCLASASLIDPVGEPLKPCTENSWTQHGIPCAHTLSSILQVDRTSGAPVVTARERLSHEVFDAFWYGHRSIYAPRREKSTVSRLRIASSQISDDPADVIQDRANSGLQNQPTPSPTSRSSSRSLGRPTPEPSNRPQPSQAWNRPKPAGSHRMEPIDLTSPPRHVQRRGPSTQLQTAITHNQNPRQSMASDPALQETVAGMLPDLLREFLTRPTEQVMNELTPGWSPHGEQRGSKRPWPTSEFAAHPSQSAWGPQPPYASVPVPGQPSGVGSATSDREAVGKVVTEELERLFPSIKRTRVDYDQHSHYNRI